VLTARRTIGLGSQSGLTKHRVDCVGRVDLSNTYRVIVLVMGLGLGLSLWGLYGRPPPATAGLLVYCGKTVRPSEKLSEGVNRKPRLKS